MPTTATPPSKQTQRSVIITPLNTLFFNNFLNILFTTFPLPPRGRWHFRKKMTEGVCWLLFYSLSLASARQLPQRGSVRLSRTPTPTVHYALAIISPYSSFSFFINSLTASTDGISCEQACDATSIAADAEPNSRASIISQPSKIP